MGGTAILGPKRLLKNTSQMKKTANGLLKGIRAWQSLLSAGANSLVTMPVR